MKNIGTKYFGLIPIGFFLLLIIVTVFVMSQAKIGGETTDFLYDQQSAKEYFWRLFWSSLLVLIVLYSVVMSWHAIKILRDNMSYFNDSTARELSWGMVGVIGVVVAFLVCSDPTFSVVRYFLKDNPEHPYMYDIVRFLFGMSSATVMLVTFSMCFVIFENKNIDVKVVQIKNREFKRSFYITAGYLGIGVVHFFSLFTWASYSRFPMEEYKILTYGVTVAASMLYTLIFVVMFVPVSIRMRTWIEKLAINEGVDIYNLEEINKFKKSNGLYDSPRNNLKQLAVLLSPALIGIFSGVLGQLFQIKATGG